MTEDNDTVEDNPSTDLADTLETVQDEVNSKMQFLHNLGIMPLDPIKSLSLKLDFFASAICEYLDEQLDTQDTYIEFEIEWYQLIKDILDEAIRQQDPDDRKNALVLL